MAAPVPAGWRTLSADASGLTRTRKELLRAARIVAAVADSYLEPMPDESERSMEWLSTGILAGQNVDAPVPFRAGIRPTDLTLVLLGPDDEPADEIALDGLTPDQAQDALDRAVKRLQQGRPSGPIRRSPDPTDEAVLTDSPFLRGTAESGSVLADWYHDAALVLEQLRIGRSRVSDTRCSLPTLKIETVMNVAVEPAGRGTRSIGTGLNPGDSTFAEPYWYVCPWPWPSHPGLPALPGNAEWHQGEWMGAVLRGSRIVQDDGAGQASEVTAFFNAGIDACTTLLAGSV
ncbi:MAG: hypothetical protein ACREL6_07830 [Gemmatimonadales bacterium]